MKGLVLEGGGAKGAYHCGAVKALYENGYRFDGVAGTSVGAVNAALIAQDEGFRTLLEVWTGTLPSDLINIDNEEVSKLFQKKFTAKSAAYWVKRVLSVLKNIGVPTDKILSFLRKKIDETKVRSSAMDYALVTVCLSDREPQQLFKEDIPEGMLHEFIMASAYYPLFRLSRLHGKYYLDGGLYDNLPVHALTEKGYEDIIAIRTKNKEPQRPILDEKIHVSYIVPSEDLGGTMELYEEKIKYNIKLGYYDALRFIRGYKGKLYYITDTLSPFTEILNRFRIDREAFFPFMLERNIDKNELLDSVSRFGTPEMTEEELLEAFTEVFARKFGMKKFRFYSSRDYLQQLSDLYRERSDGGLSIFYAIRGKRKNQILFNGIMQTYRSIYEN